jgi:hypothetical protein
VSFDKLPGPVFFVRHFSCGKTFLDDGEGKGTQHEGGQPYAYVGHVPGTNSHHNWNSANNGANKIEYNSLPDTMTFLGQLGQLTANEYTNMVTHNWLNLQIYIK